MLRSNEYDYRTEVKTTKVQTLGGIWRKYWNIWIENTLHAYVLGEHTSMKNELEQTKSGVCL